eukprot:362361_1
MATTQNAQHRSNQPTKRTWFDRWSILRISIMFIFFAYLLNKMWDVTMMNTLLFHPERAHYSSQQFINSKSNRLFEGWYYKIASKDFQFAIIPGAYHSTNQDGNYAFIMLVATDFMYAYRYPIHTYITSHGSIHTDQQFYINIGPNNFSRNSVSLHLESKYIHSIQPINYKNISIPIKIHLSFLDQDIGFPVTLFQLGAMGYYGWIPFLECYHGILAMNYLVFGSIQINNKFVYKYEENNNDNSELAHGYLEKDWGTNFPQTWIWIQANNFEKDENVSLTLALARLPMIGDSIVTKAGYLGGLYLNKKVYKLGTYTWSVVKKLDIIDEKGNRKIDIEIHSFWGYQRLKVIANIPNEMYTMNRDEARKLKPHLLVPQSDGYMMPTLLEWINARVWIRFEDDDMDLVFESESYPATVECHSDDNMEYIKTNFV